MAKNKHRINIFPYIVVGLLIVATVVFCVIFFTQNKPDGDAEKDKDTSQNTEEEIAKKSNEAKDRMEADEKKTEEPEKTETGSKLANPSISFIALEDDKLAVGGLVSNINETDGNCIYIFWKGSESFTVSAGILPNPSYISCETVRVDKTKFSSGTWNIKIKYKSNTAEGESETQTYTAQ